MNINCLPLFFILSLVSVGEVKLKIYPFFFGVFIFFYLLSGLPVKKKLIPALVFLLLSLVFVFLNAWKSFDSNALLKLTLNLVFLFVAGSYVLALPKQSSLSLFRVSSAIFIFISFFQVFFVVYKHSLWMLPFQLNDSSSSYAIQQIDDVFFGDLNKNIWASKISIFAMLFCFCQFYKKQIFFIPIFFMSLFCLLYVSSRTAQLAFLVFLLSLFIFDFWVVKRKKLILLLLGFIAIPFFSFLFLALIRIDFQQILHFHGDIGDHHGDGFLARLIIWQYVFHSMNISNIICGNGIMSFVNYTNGVFSENNPHNVFINVLLDFGVLPFVGYLILLYTLFFESKLSIFLFAPALVFLNSQYLGYDADLIVYFIFILFAGAMEKMFLMKNFMVEIV